MYVKDMYEAGMLDKNNNMRDEKNTSKNINNMISVYRTFGVKEYIYNVKQFVIAMDIRTEALKGVMYLLENDDGTKMAMKRFLDIVGE